jgi:membrane protease subunit HflC
MTNRQRILLGLLTLGLLLLYPVGRAVMFVVNERELAVVLRFGEPVAHYNEPGLFFKMPFVDEVRRLPKSYQFWSAAGGEILTDLPTADGKKVEVTPWAVWRITDPIRFVERLRTMENAETRVQTFVRGEMRDVITTNALAEVVRSTDRKLTYTFQVEPIMGESLAPEEKRRDPQALDAPQVPSETPLMQQPGAGEKIRVGREKIVERIKGVVQQRLARSDEGDSGGRGIEVVDVGIARIDFVPVVQQAAFDRLIAFMESIAALHTNDGERRKQEIINRTEAEVQKILGEGRQESNRIRGEVDAEIIDAYAKAIREAGEFYNFVRTLEVYQKALKSNTRLILTTESPLLRLLKEGVGTGAPAAKAAPEKEK